MAFDFWKKKQPTQEPVITCAPATEEDISNIFQETIFTYRIPYSGKQLREITMQIPESSIPWSSIHALFICGGANNNCNILLTRKKIVPGAYVNHDRTCLILIQPNEFSILRCLNRCGSHLKTLNLFHTALTFLDVSSLMELELLDASCNNYLRRIDGLSKLTHLAKLDLSGCKSLRVLPSMENLTQLTELSLSGCEILQELPSMENLTRLTKLNLSGCEILQELPSMENLTQLTKLDLFECRNLRALPSMENLTRLTELTLSRCYSLQKLPKGIHHMRALRTLDLSFMHLQELPDWLPEIAEGFSLDIKMMGGTEKAIVHLCETTVYGISDMSIFSQPYEVVAEWFKNRALGKTRTLNEIKVVFLGDGEAGKSLTIARLMNDGGDPKGYVNVRTPGIVIKDLKHSIGNREATLHLWDFGGQDIMHSMHRIFLTKRTIYVVLVDGSIGNQDERARYWLQNIQSFAEGAPVVLVLNKLDDGLQADVNAVDLCNKYKGLKRIVKLSALQYSKERFNKALTEVLLEEIEKTGYLDTQWPESWVRVKTELEQMKENYIRGDAYLKICEDCAVDQQQKPLLDWFHDLGISFRYCDDQNRALEDYVVLKPNWITNALYIILFNERENGKGGLVPVDTIRKMLSRNAPNRDAIKRVIPDAFYAGYEVNYVLDVFHVFQLSFPEEGGYEFFPMLADINARPVAEEYAKDKDCLEFNMEFDYLPSNLLHRLMVDRHGELDMDNVWRTGARFHHRELGYSAVVVIDGNTLRFFIRHADPMHRPNTYLTMLKSNVDRIVERMGLKVPTCKLVYKLDGKRDEFDYEMLKAMLDAGQSQAFSMTWRRMFPIQGILNQSAPDGLKDEMQLLDAIRRSCNHLQDERCYRLDPNASNRDKEDLRNRRVRDDLETLGYRVSDQTQRGGGELDLRILDDSRKPWTIIEALRISNGTKREWNEHLNKLVGRYNTNGLPVLYLLTYVDATPAGFDQIWTDYQRHIPAKDTESYTCIKDSHVDLNANDHRYVQAAKYRYACGSLTTTVYHIFARIPLSNE